MDRDDKDILFAEIKHEVAGSPCHQFGLIGHTPFSYDVKELFQRIGATDRLSGIYAQEKSSGVKCFGCLATDRPAVVIIASDHEKEELLESAMPYLEPSTKVLIGGYGHFAFRNKTFETAITESLVQSLANGYPNTLIHLYQCLENAARLRLEGVVAEFGMFKGGTTMILSEFIERLGQRWQVIGFDTFSGFPARRSPLDMYDHPGCVFHNEAAVRNYLRDRRVEIVSGDIVTTVARLLREQIVLAFVDTDNYTPAAAVLDVIQDRVAVGGAIVFDHFAGRKRFKYTLGERIAAKRLLADGRYFNLHDSGVFLRQI